MSLMKNRFYIIRYPAISKYDIEKPDDNVDQESADTYFINLLANIACSRGSRTKLKSEMFACLSYHLSETSATKSEFISHTEKLFKANHRELNPFTNSKQDVLDWIRLAKQKYSVTEQKPVIPKVNTAPTKDDPEFEQVVKDKERMKAVIDQLKRKGIITEKGEWQGIKVRAKNIELVALIHILTESKIIFALPKSLLGRVFSKTFNCPMNSRYYVAVQKNVTIERIKQEIVHIV